MLRMSCVRAGDSHEAAEIDQPYRWCCGNVAACAAAAAGAPPKNFPESREMINSRSVYLLVLNNSKNKEKNRVDGIGQLLGNA